MRDVSAAHATVDTSRGHGMSHGHALGVLTRLSAGSLGVFRGRAAVQLGVTRTQLVALATSGAIERVLPDTYRMSVVTPSHEQSLRAALLWAGDGAIAAGLSAGEMYGLERVRALRPEIVVPRSKRLRSANVLVHQSDDRRSLRVRRRGGIMVSGVEPTLVGLATSLDAEAFEIACEDARRRRLTSVPALRAYLLQFPGRPGAAMLGQLLDELDPVHAARSTLEVKTRRLLVAHGLTRFEREFPLAWNGRTYLFDFAFPADRVVLETNGRRWHDDAMDYEHDNEKWSVPARCGYRIVFATWEKVTREPARLLAELTATLAVSASSGPRTARSRAGERDSRDGHE
jgi:very-short-patch-repair endonuclease